MVDIFMYLAVASVAVFAVSLIMFLFVKSKSTRIKCGIVVVLSAVCEVFCITQMFNSPATSGVDKNSNVDNRVGSVETSSPLPEHPVASEVTSEPDPAPAETSPVSESEAPAPSAPSAAPSKSIASAYKTDIVVAAKMTLDRFISDYSVSLAVQNWTVSDFDSDGAVIALADVTFKSSGETARALLVLTPDFEGGKVTSATPHYVAVGNTVYGDDGYCDDTFSTIQEALESYEAAK